MPEVMTLYLFFKPDGELVEHILTMDQEVAYAIAATNEGWRYETGVYALVDAPEPELTAEERGD